MKKTIVILLILLVAGAGYYAYVKNAKKANAPAVSNSTGQNTQPENNLSSPTSTTGQAAPATTTAPSSPTTQAQGTYSSGESGDLGNDMAVEEVDYNGSSFSPSTLNIKVGDYVFFKNSSQNNFWISAITDYPEFNSQKALGPGKQFKFQFLKPGNWIYKDYLNPTASGTVIVAR